MHALLIDNLVAFPNREVVMSAQTPEAFSKQREGWRVRKRYRIVGLVALGVVLASAPIMAFSSGQYQQQADNYISTHCKARVSSLVALRCFLYGRTQELGQSLAGLSGRVADVETKQIPRLDSANSTQEANILALQTGLEDAAKTLSSLKNAEPQNANLNTLSGQLKALQEKVDELSKPGDSSGNPKVLDANGKVLGTLAGGGVYIASINKLVPLNPVTGDVSGINFAPVFLDSKCQGQFYFAGPQSGWTIFKTSGIKESGHLVVPSDEPSQHFEGTYYADMAPGCIPLNGAIDVVKPVSVTLPFTTPVPAPLKLAP
jgi:hypothetical protein